MMHHPNAQQPGQSLPRQSLPVGLLAVPVQGLSQDAAPPILMAGMALFGELPILDRKNRLLGILRDHEQPLFSLSAQLQNLSPVVTLRKTDPVETAISRFDETSQDLIPIVDTKGRYSGQCASRSKLRKFLQGELRPQRVGGLATPLGVFMTSGVHMAGSGWKGLVATGVMFGVLIQILDWLSLIAYSAAASVFPDILYLPASQQLMLQIGFIMTFLLGALRLSPLSGLHAAEHMTINAIENDLPLTPAAVKTQPREHFRCGTNLMVMLGGIQLVVINVFGLMPYITWPGLTLYTLFWYVVISWYSRPVGLWIQRYFTTKTPTSAQLASGLRAGHDLLEKFSADPHPVPGFWRKVWGSGIPHMLAAFAVTSWLLGLLTDQLGL